MVAETASPFHPRDSRISTSELCRQDCESPSTANSQHFTPLMSKWADEMGFNSRQTSEILLPSAKNSDLFEVGETLVFVADDDCLQMEDDQALTEESENVDEDGRSQVAIGVSEPTSPGCDRMQHVALRMVHNPHDLYHPFQILQACECSTCTSLVGQQISGRSTVDSFSASVSADNASLAPSMSNGPTQSYSEYCQCPGTCVCSNNNNAMGPAAVGASPLKDYATRSHFDGRVSPRSCYPPLPPLPGMFATRSNETMITEPTTPQTPLTESPFMPPPPPPRVSEQIMREAPEHYYDADKVFYKAMLRWYKRAGKVESRWVAKQDVCPTPPDDIFESPYTFDQWCDMAACWWFAHFEHRQKRQRPFYYTRYQ